MNKIGEVWGFSVGAPSTIEAVAVCLQDNGILGATITTGKGLWQGILEDCVLVSIAGLSEQDAVALAHALRRQFSQEAVYVEHESVAYLATKESSTVAFNL